MTKWQDAIVDILTKLTDERDMLEEAVERLRSASKLGATSARALGDTGKERAWLDVAAIIEQTVDLVPEPACLIHDCGEDVPGWEMAECTCPWRKEA